MRRNKNDLFEKIEDDLRKIISYNTSVDTSSIDDKKSNIYSIQYFQQYPPPF